MPTTLHGSMSGLFIRSVVTWQNVLMQSSDDRISNAAESLRPYPESSVSLKGGSDLKTPDCSMQHICERPCLDPTLVLEVAWTETKEELRQKADMYSKLFSGSFSFESDLYSSNFPQFLEHRYVTIKRVIANSHQYALPTGRFGQL